MTIRRRPNAENQLRWWPEEAPRQVEQRSRHIYGQGTTTAPSGFEFFFFVSEYTALKMCISLLLLLNMIIHSFFVC